MHLFCPSACLQLLLSSLRKLSGCRAYVGIFSLTSPPKNAMEWSVSCKHFSARIFMFFATSNVICNFLQYSWFI